MTSVVDIALIQNSPLLSNLSARYVFSLVNLGSFSSKRMSSRLASLLGSPPPFKKPGPSAGCEKVKGRRYLKEMLILNSFSFEGKDPQLTRLKPSLALGLLSK